MAVLAVVTALSAMVKLAMRLRKIAYLLSIILFCSSLEAEPKKFNFQVLQNPMKMNVRATAYTHTELDHLIYGRRSAYGSYLQSSEKYTSAAADWSFLPLGTVFRIKGNPTIFVIDDYGSALINKNTVDLYFKTHAEMNQWGARKVEIEILRVGDFRQSYLILRDRCRWPHCYAMAKRIYERYQKEAEATKQVAEN